MSELKEPIRSHSTIACIMSSHLAVPSPRCGRCARLAINGQLSKMDRLRCNKESACLLLRDSDSVYGLPKINAWLGQFWTQAGNIP